MSLAPCVAAGGVCACACEPKLAMRATAAMPAARISFCNTGNPPSHLYCCQAPRPLGRQNCSQGSRVLVASVLVQSGVILAVGRQYAKLLADGGACSLRLAARVADPARPRTQLDCRARSDGLCGRSRVSTIA